MTKGTIPQEDVMIINVHAPTAGVPEHTEQKFRDVEGETDSSTAAGDFIIPLT